MSLEIEAKFPLRDPAPSREHLYALAGQPFAQLLEFNTLFDTHDDRLRNTGCGLRLRVEQDLTARGDYCTLLTYKGPRQPGLFKQREEIQTQLADADAAVQILQALGFTPKLAFEKRRCSWHVDDCRVELDQLPLLGHFLEIEGPNDASIRLVRNKLNLQDSALEGRSYPQILDEYLRLHSLPMRNITFDPPSYVSPSPQAFPAS